MLDVAAVPLWEQSPVRGLRTALVGLGVAGRRHLESGMMGAFMEPVGLSDPDDASVAAAQGLISHSGRQPLPVHSDPKDLIRSLQPELVVVASPDHWHARHAQTAVEQGAHVLLETMPARSAAEIAELSRLAAARGRVVAVVAPWRLSPALLRARAHLADGGLGELEEVQVVVREHSPSAPKTQEPAASSVDWHRWLGGTPWPEEARASLLDRGWSRWLPFGRGVFSGQGFRALDEVLWVTGQETAQTVFAAAPRWRGRKAQLAPRELIAVVNWPQGRLTWRHRAGAAPVGPDASGYSSVIRGSQGMLAWGADGQVSAFGSGGQLLWSVPAVSCERLDAGLWQDLSRAVAGQKPAATGLQLFSPAVTLAGAIQEAAASGRTLALS